MIIQSVKLTNFRNMTGTQEFTFDKLNLIVGRNGAGKSTIGRISILFALFGTSDVPLSKLPTRGQSTAAVELFVEDRGEQVRIVRSIPTRLLIYVNDVEILQESTNTAKDEWLKKRFGDLDYFRKFRMIDLVEGINLLEEGKTSLRKTLVSFHEGVLNNIRQRLQAKKLDRERFNKDSAVVYKHFPSENRKVALVDKINRLNTSIRELDNHVSQVQTQFSKTQQKTGEYGAIIRQALSSQREAQRDKCQACKQTIPYESRRLILESCQKQIEEYTKLNKELEQEVQLFQGEFSSCRIQKDKLYKKVQKSQSLLNRLNVRLQQKQYKYTTKDVLVVNNAIKHLDKLYSQIILESVKSLEPIINSIVCKIGFELEFQLNEKADFDLVLKRDGENFSYKDLSNGQRLILTIAFQIALLLDKGESGIMIADEGFSSLDEHSLVALYELFSDLPFQVISIVHRFDQYATGIKIIRLGETNGVRESKESVQEGTKAYRRAGTEETGDRKNSPSSAEAKRIKKPAQLFG